MYVACIQCCGNKIRILSLRVMYGYGYLFLPEKIIKNSHISDEHNHTEIVVKM